MGQQLELPLTVRCVRCGAPIPPDEVEEHLGIGPLGALCCYWRVVRETPNPKADRR
jgi:hypothetical protein